MIFIRMDSLATQIDPDTCPDAPSWASDWGEETWAVVKAFRHPGELVAGRTLSAVLVDKEKEGPEGVRERTLEIRVNPILKSEDLRGLRALIQAQCRLSQTEISLLKVTGDLFMD